MKNAILIVMTIFSVNVFSQDSLLVKKISTQTRIFSFTPRSKKVSKVNGLAFGLGINSILVRNSPLKTINGINLEVNPISVLLMFFADPSRINSPENPDYSVNGLNISTGNFNNARINGLNISGFNISHTCNGISISGFYNYSQTLNGLHITGLSNYSEKSNGLNIALFNEAETLNGIQIGSINKSINSNGLQLGIYNTNTNHVGIQIGLFNFTNKIKGLQLGFWNVNGKRSMPFINF